jgi:mannosyltransferase OCH1-like enzyme
MIPKVIHYCWLNGDPFPDVIEKCLESWHDKLPGYEIKEWNCNNFDVNICDYTKEAFSVKKYAFVSDYMRLYALYNEGGIYLDTDVEVFKSFDDLLTNRAFVGFEGDDALGTCLLASEKGNDFIGEMLSVYKNKHFIHADGSMNMMPNSYMLVPLFKKYGITLNNKLQKTKYITVYPKDYFCPFNSLTDRVNVTANTYAMHLFFGSWLPDGEKKQIIFRKERYKHYYNRYKMIFSDVVADILAKIFSTYDTFGFFEVVKKISVYVYKKLVSILKR